MDLRKYISAWAAKAITAAIVTGGAYYLAKVGVSTDMTVGEALQILAAFVSGYVTVFFTSNKPQV